MKQPIDRVLFWIGSSRKDLRAFPEPVKDIMGYALYLAQTGGKHPSAKPLKGRGCGGVLEIIDDFQGATYRGVYTLRLKGAVYVLHAFQKKSKSGIATAKHDLDLIQRRMKQAEGHHAEWTKAREKKVADDGKSNGRRAK